MSCFLISPFYGLLPLRAELYLIVGFSFFSPLFCSFLQFYCHFLLNYSAIPAVMSFDLGLLGSFGPAAILLSMIGVSNSSDGLTHPVYPTGPRPTAGRPDYSGGRRRVFFSRIRSGRFGLGSSPQNPKKPESTELYSIFHRIWRHLVVYAQIQLQSNGFCSNKAQIR